MLFQRLHDFIFCYLTRVISVEYVVFIQPIAANQCPLGGIQVLHC